MKRSLVLATLSLIVVFTAGCATLGRNSAAPVPYRPRAFALAITVHGGLQPTPQQWAMVQAKVAESLAVHGWVLVTDLALADNILRVDFTPDPNYPENRGVARIIAIRANPRLSIASSTSVGRYPTSFSYLGSFQNASWGYSGFSNNYYYGWGNSYYDGFSYGSANLNPTDAPFVPPARPNRPPHRQHPDRRDDCPPIADHYIRPRPHRPFDADRLPSPGQDLPAREERRGWAGRSEQSQLSPTFTRSGASPRWEETISRSDSTVPRAERTYSRADPSPSRLNRSSSASGSSAAPRSERTYARSESSASRPERTYASSDSNASSPERTYPRSESSRAWRDRSDSSSARSDEASTRPTRTYSRSDSSDSRSERTYTRSESSHSRSDSSYSRSDPSPRESSPPPSPPPAPAPEPPSSSSSEASSSGLPTDPAR